VVELLDDLRERITSHYAFQLNEALREHQGSGAADDDEDDEPF